MLRDPRPLMPPVAEAFAADAGELACPIHGSGQRQYVAATALAPQPDPVAFPGQDPRYGRDAAAGDDALAKLRRGAFGFDITRLGVDGQPLAIQDQLWARDAGGFRAGSEAAVMRARRLALGRFVHSDHARPTRRP